MELMSTRDVRSIGLQVVRHRNTGTNQTTERHHVTFIALTLPVFDLNQITSKISPFPPNSGSIITLVTQWSLLSDCGLMGYFCGLTLLFFSPVI